MAERNKTKNRIMSKAEDRGLEKYPIEMYKEVGWRCVDKNADKRKYFIEGYHQAEKDLELTWEDMRELYIIFAEVDTEIELCKTDIKAETIGYYQEILKRFKNLKK